MSSSTLLVNYGSVEGPFLIGVMISCALSGITCAQTAYYYRTYPEDDRYRKMLVGILFLLELAHLMLVGEAVHFLFVFSKIPEHVGGILFIRTTFSASYVITVVITSLVQGFYALRVWSVGQSRAWKKAIVGGIIASSFAQFCLGIAVSSLLFLHTPLPAVHAEPFQGLYSAQLAIAMICDIVITLALVYYLNQSRSGFNSTDNTIDRLIIYSVNIGLVTSAVSVCIFTTFHALPKSTTFALFTEIISKIYVNSLLVTLNSRKSIGRGLNRRVTETIPLPPI